jgi:CheY-like chemotaxis protein
MVTAVPHRCEHRLVTIRCHGKAAAAGGANLMPKLKILLAEDEPSMARYIQMLMSEWDCELAVEQTGADAISRAATFQPDIALLGFVTPGVDGAKAGVELLKESPRTKVVLAVESVPHHVLSDLRAQGYEFRTLAAPFNEEELRAVCFPPLHPRVE